jgi:tRNA nucleotidyltransferase/poly(A) polymerase
MNANIENLNNTLLEAFLILNGIGTDVNLVGGCVRDMLLGRTPKDFDIVMRGDFDQIINELKSNGWKVGEFGKKFLVIKAKKNKQEFDIALYRKDGTYTDGRRPETVDLGSIEEDSQRRDFTVNAIYYNPLTNECIDPCNGLKDIKSKTLRFIGSAEERINEDKLRIMRAYRLSAQLGFEINDKCLKACRKNFAGMLKDTDPMRVMQEMEKMHMVTAKVV